jgi:hypothetical protein
MGGGISVRALDHELGSTVDRAVLPGFLSLSPLGLVLTAMNCGPCRAADYFQDALRPRPSAGYGGMLPVPRRYIEVQGASVDANRRRALATTAGY